MKQYTFIHSQLSSSGKIRPHFMEKINIIFFRSMVAPFVILDDFHHCDYPCLLRCSPHRQALDYSPVTPTSTSPQAAISRLCSPGTTTPDKGHSIFTDTHAPHNKSPWIPTWMADFLIRAGLLEGIILVRCTVESHNGRSQQNTREKKKSLQPLFHHRNVASPGIFYRYFQANCMPPLFLWPRAHKVFLFLSSIFHLTFYCKSLPVIIHIFPW